MSKRNYKLTRFSRAFINKVDELLQNDYSKKLPREKFYMFYELIERQSTSHPEKTFRNIKARLKASYISNLLGWRHYKSIIDISIEKGIIQTDNSYIVGQKSKDYWIALNFANDVEIEELTIQEYIMTNNSTLYKKIKSSYNRSEFDRKHWGAYKMLNQIEFDYPSAIKWLSNLVTEGYFDTDITFATHKYNTYQRMINDMNDKKWVIVEDNKTGRIFHTFNLIKRELRGFCYVNGESLVQSDLKSSQPYFLASRLLKTNGEDENIKTFYEDVTKKDIYTELLKEYVSLNGHNAFQSYKLKREHGKVVSCEKSIEYFDSRDDIKPEFLKVMYKGINGGAALLNVFKQAYPSVYKEINKIKSTDKKYLPLTLQKDEATIFIEAYKNVSSTEWCLSCHDSLYVKSSDKDFMLETVIAEFEKHGYKDYELK